LFPFIRVNLGSTRDQPHEPAAEDRIYMTEDCDDYVSHAIFYLGTHQRVKWMRCNSDNSTKVELFLQINEYV